MAKRLTVEDHLAMLKSLRAARSAPETKAEIKKALANKINLIAARAAEMAGEFSLIDLGPDLIAAFDRFIVDGADKGCTAKTSIVKALYELAPEHEKLTDLFLQAIRHVQKEGSYGPPVDVAAEMRGLSALGLVRIGYRHAMIEVAELMADRELQARIGAIRAVAYSGQDQGLPLLRYKIAIGDQEPDVMAECFQAILAMSPKQSLPVVARFLDSSDDAICDNAALAIGGTKLPEAFELLQSRWKRILDESSRRNMLLSIALTRVPQSVPLLLAIIETETASTAADAVRALGIYHSDSAISARVHSVVNKRNNRDVTAAFDDTFRQ